MNEDVVQWLNEIRTLKQQLAEVLQEREEAVSREANWRKLYSTEAQQRRAENKLAQEEIKSLKDQLQQQPFQPAVVDQMLDSPEAESEDLAGLDTIEALQGKLKAVMAERDQLQKLRDRALEALQAEQENHAQTRKSLTAVISDTIDQIAKQRQQESG
jgi:septum formation inhibitor-activating ATPase MinD